MRAYLIVATGRPTFGQLALNLCLSIKANEPASKVMLLYSPSAVDGNEDRIDRFFDYKKNFTSAKGPAELAHWLKLQCYDLARQEGITEAIVLDADTIVLPGKKPSEWFNQGEDGYESGLSFVTYTNDVYDFEKKEYKYSKDETGFWCDPEKAKLHFCKNEWQERFSWKQMPQINASFIYFKVNEEAKKVFDTALEVWHDEEFKDFKSFRGTKTEEMCFNIAMAKHQVLLRSVPYRPLYLQAHNTTLNEHYIQHRFKAFTLAGAITHDSRLVSFYNTLSDYYRGYFGITEKFHFEQDMKVIKDPRPIIGFWHVCMMNNWESVVKEQLSLLKKHGLYDAAKYIHVCAVGSEGDFKQLKKILSTKKVTEGFVLIEYGKFTVNYKGVDITRYEYPTLDLLKTSCENEPPYFGFYFHTKGVSNPKGDHWRDYLNYFNLVKWRDMQGKIRNGYDLCGVKLLTQGEPPFPRHATHYSGNFWHYDSDYIKTLKPISSLNQANRFDAESWVCSNNPKAATLSQKIIDHYSKVNFREDWYGKTIYNIKNFFTIDNLKKLFKWH